MTLDEQALSSWIQHRRWYATKNQPIEAFAVASQSQLQLAGQEVLHLVVSITTNSREDLYQLLVTSADRDYVEANVYADSVISSSEHPIYELFGDTKALLGLVDVFNQSSAFSGIEFEVYEELSPVQTARVILSEQSNSSVILGDHSIAKFYRRLTPGINPDLEIGHALNQVNCGCVPRVRGSAHGDVRGQFTTLMVLHEFYPTAVDGFEHALASVRDFIASDVDPSEAGGDFSAEAERLGIAVRTLHEDLATAFGQSLNPIDPLIELMIDRLHRAAREVPELQAFEDRIAQRYLAARGAEVLMQRIHGDLHLGQVLRDPTGWLILDFEGEPGAPLAERRALAPAVRDVAAMLRSFDYAARQPLISHPDKEKLLPRTAEWARRNRAAFLRGYGEQLSEIGAIFELDKAVYEALYEHRFRPDWIEVPLGGIARLLEE